jgi:D-aspartate ligase
MSAHIYLPPDRLERVPVLLLGGVSLVRALGLAGIPAIVAGSDVAEPAFASRYCAGRCLLPPPEQGDAAIDAIVRIGDRLSALYGRRVPLMYGNDDYLELIYAHRQRLERYFLLLLNDAEVADALLVKDRFQAFAEGRGLPVPRSLRWEGDGPGALAAAEGPVLVKPSNKVDWHDSMLRRRVFHDAKALIFASGAQAAAEPNVAIFHEQLTFQEYVPGDDRCIWSFHGITDGDGVMLDSFIGRKLRTYPTRTGESSFIELDNDAELRALGVEIAAKVPLKGVFKMDFKKDARTGRWNLLEINARFNLWHYLGARNGVNLLRVAYDYVLDGTRPSRTRGYATHFRWLSLELDVRAFRELHARGELGLMRWLASLVLSRNVYNLFAWRDPGPWMRFWAFRFARHWGRGPGRFLSVVRQWRSTAS